MNEDIVLLSVLNILLIEYKKEKKIKYKNLK